MESLSYTSEGRGHPFTDDVELNMCSHERRRNLLKVWDAERFSVPTRDVFEVEPDLADMIRKSGVGTHCLEHAVDDANGDSSKSLPSVSTFTPYPSMEVGLGFSSPAVETGDEKLLQSGFEITNSEAPIKPKCNQSSVANSLLSSQEPSVSTQRARIANLQSQIQVCLVHGCKRDLSSLKEYHKRHKVCDIHSKTSVVIVNGIQQRFCQQCSRFHILAEFDESKRSCRKRLADHNGRRRKPRLDTQLGSMLDLSRTSLHFSKTLAGGFFGQQCDEPPNHSKHVKLEMEPTQIHQSVAPLKFGPSLSIPLLHLPEMGKQYSPQTCLNSQPSVAELSTGSSSSCAFSLLSAQLHSSLTNSASISMDHPLILEGYHHADLTFNQISTKSLGKSTPENLAPVVFSSSGEMEKRIPESEPSEESDGLNLKSYLYPEGVNTVDLFQLSLHLQRVEQQKCSSSAIPL